MLPPQCKLIKDYTLHIHQWKSTKQATCTLVKCCHKLFTSSELLYTKYSPRTNITPRDSPLKWSIYLHKMGYSAGYSLSGNMNHIEDCKHTWCSNMPVSWPTLAADLSISPHFIVSNLLSALWYSERDNSKSFKVTADELWCRNAWVSEIDDSIRKINKIQIDDYM